MCIFINNIILFCLNLTEDNIYASNLIECAICMDKNKQIIFYPCKHFYCCDNCSKLLKLCPICCSIINIKIKYTL